MYTLVLCQEHNTQPDLIQPVDGEFITVIRSICAARISELEEKFAVTMKRKMRRRKRVQQGRKFECEESGAQVPVARLKKARGSSDNEKVSTNYAALWELW
ncbi:hypothetical protein GcM3_105018 [Golovinomyces cichoracearum]|uniref:Uncharacterized protein n=1 Tax=Golovinomyces cichoracearum TaxID=62708 RepID=A0A420I9R7_9PEZI|nr:hypothetical protein GcM3_105018 [Golovinomyces cichoracearum]